VRWCQRDEEVPRGGLGSGHQVRRRRRERPAAADRQGEQALRSLSATRRAARTVYMGSAAAPDGSRGVDIKSIVLGCVQPGEPSASSATRSSGCPGRPPTSTSTAPSTGTRSSPTSPASPPTAPRRTSPTATPTTKSRSGLLPNRVACSRRCRSSPKAPATCPTTTTACDSSCSPGRHPSGQRHQLRPRSAWPTRSSPARRRATAEQEHAGLRRRSRESAQRTAGAARSHLAWKSIVADHEALDLTAHQRKQAESKVAETQRSTASSPRRSRSCSPRTAARHVRHHVEHDQGTATGTLAERVARSSPPRRSSSRPTAVSG
jgi:hypothetical protein